MREMMALPFYTAAESGLEGIVSTLLARGADKDADGHGATPLIRAGKAGHLTVANICWLPVQMLRFEIVEATLQSLGPPVVRTLEFCKPSSGVSGADVKAVGDSSGWSALHVTADSGQAECHRRVDRGRRKHRAEGLAWMAASELCSILDSTRRCDALYAPLRHGANAHARAV